MWQVIATLLIAAPGAASDGASAFVSNRDDQAIGRESALSPAAIEDHSVAEAPWTTSDSGLNQGYDPTATQYGGFAAASGYGAAPCSLSVGPCIFNSVWDVTGGRLPTDYVGPWGYGPDWCRTWRADVEWLLWFSRGRDAPVLARITTPASGTKPEKISDYPREPIGTDMRNGARITLGHLLADDATWLEGRFWGLENGAERFTARSSGAVGAPTIGNPFFNVNSGLATQHFVAGPGFGTNGSINILSRNSLFGGDAWLRRTWWDDGVRRLDVLAGYQFTRLDDSMVIEDRATSPAGQPAGTVSFSRDSFGTQNEFHGASLGFISDWRKNWLSLQVLGKVAFGDMRQFVSIQGHSSLNPPGGATGPGVFVFRSNTGNFERHQFAISPELNINGVIHFSPAWRAMAGYSIIYWSNAVLAGNQIDTQIDPTQTIAQPRFHFQRTDFLVQGINLGAEYRW